MSIVKASGKLRLVALLIIASPFVMAQDRGWYVGANIGQSKAKIDDPGITTGLLSRGFTSVTISDRDHDLGFKLFGGYQINKYFAFEGGYFDLGKFGFTADTVPLGTFTGDAKFKGFNLDAVFSLPFTEKFSAFLRAGVINAEAKDTFSGTGMVTVSDPNPSDRVTKYKFGAGLQYDFTRSFGMRAEVERYRINDAVNNMGDIDLASIGVLFRFGRKAPAPAPYEPTPEPYVAPPPPPPLIVAPPVVVIPPVKTQDYCTILDLTFEIDKGDIQKDDLEKLAVVGTFLTKYPGTTAVIEGHTDNVGTEEHNLKLSKERAESVVTYLVDTVHVDRARLSAVGYGWTRPIADNDTEDGMRQNRRINAVVSCVTDIEGLKVKPARITMEMEIEFDLLKDDIRPESRSELRKAANFLKANPSVTAVVEGHAGKIKTTDASAMEISKRRAENVVNVLVTEFGIDRSRLTAEGFGKTRRDAYSDTKEGQQQNRRVNLIIVYPRK